MLHYHRMHVENELVEIVTTDDREIKEIVEKSFASGLCIRSTSLVPGSTTVRTAVVGTTAYCDPFLRVVEKVNCSCPQGSA